MHYSSRQAAQKLGITGAALSKYLKAKKVPAPKSAVSGGMTLYFWTAEEIENVRKLLPKIANGRKTRHKKKESAKAKKKK